MRRLIGGLTLGLTLIAVAGATTYVVRPDGTGDFPTIDAAIHAVPDGSIIELTDGIFVGEGNRDLVYHGKAITIRSQSGDPTRCILDLADAAPHNGFIFQDGEDSLSVLDGVTLRNGHNMRGAGFMCWNGSSPRIAHCVLSNNTSDSGDWGGGAIFCFDSSPVIEDCRLAGNTAVYGGALMARNGAAPILRRVTFDGNLATGSGGALHLYESGIRADDCLFQGNAATETGGALASGNLGSRVFTRCTFTGNAAAVGGAILTNNDGTYTFTSCIFSENTANDGAGIYSDLLGSYYFYYCTFVGNRASRWGGAVACRRIENYTFWNCTFSANAAARGGVLWDRPDARVKFEECILAFSTSGEAIFCDGVTRLPRLSCTDVYGNAGGDWVDCIEGQSYLRGNISLDPLFCDGPLEDLQLREDSPCAPYAPPHPDCPLVGAWPVACGGPESVESESAGATPDRLWIRLAAQTPCTHDAVVDFGVSASAAGVPLDLTLHTVTGALVRTLARGVRDPGVHRVRWNGNDGSGQPVPAGVYLCRLVVGRQQSTMRLVWVR